MKSFRRCRPRTPIKLQRVGAAVLVVDAVKESSTRLRNVLGQEDRYRLDGYMQGLVEIERELNATEGECTLPQRPADGPQWGHQVTVNGPLQVKLAVLALSCGITPVVTMIFARECDAFPVPSSYLNWHDLFHEASIRAPNDPDQEVLTRGFETYQTIFADLVQQLDTTPDPDTPGKMLSETTVALFTSEFGDGSGHRAIRTPATLATKHPSIRTGGRHLNSRSGWTNSFLVSLLQAFGQPDTRFGQAAVGGNAGPMPGIGA